MDGYLPFDPDKIKTPDKPKPARRERARRDPAEDALTVSEVTAKIKAVLEAHTERPLRVVGEISNFNDRGHWYFSLKDESDVLSCVMWSSAAKKVSFAPERGLSVIATGRLDYFGPQGRLQLYVDRLDPVGAGALELRFQQMCDALREKGWFAQEIKRPLPAFAQHVAVVTSATGAAVQDVIKTARQRWAGCRLSVVDVRVQGEGAKDEIAAAIRALDANREALGIDAIVVTRGGGSMEDLWAFNEMVVAEAIHDCRVPVVAAIGHETDLTIAELVGDLRCSTPTQAAVAVVPDGAVEAERVEQLDSRLLGGMKRRAEHAQLKLTAIERMEVFRSPTGVIDLKRRDLAHIQQHLGALLKGRLGQAQKQTESTQVRLDSVLKAAWRRRCEALEAMAKQLGAIGPRRVLERGYSFTTDLEGRLLTSIEGLGAGDRVRTRLADGAFESEIDRIEEGGAD